MANTRGAVVAMYVGLGLTVLATLVPHLDRGRLVDHTRAGYPDYTQTQVDSAVSSALVLLTIVGGLGVLAWLWTAWAVKAGKRWSRAAATTMFVLGLGVGLTVVLVKDASGDTFLPQAHGWPGMVPSVAGAVAIALLWRGRQPAVAPSRTS